MGNKGRNSKTENHTKEIGNCTKETENYSKETKNHTKETEEHTKETEERTKETKNHTKETEERTKEKTQFTVDVPSANRIYKDTMFWQVFREKKELLSLYNAVNGTAYTDPEVLEVVTLENAVYMTVKNDLAFLFMTELNLYEHQSTHCPNIPLRLLIYVADEYQKLVDMDALYRSAPVKIPVPRFVVFYNGMEKQPERMELRLSDLYEKKVERPELELLVTMLNINLGKNEALMAACGTLHEYAIFVDLVRRYTKELGDFQAAVPKAVDECIEKGVLREFLLRNKEEAVKMSLYECNLERAWYHIRQAEAERGFQQGLERGMECGMEQGMERGRTEGMKRGIELGSMQRLMEQVGRKLAKGKSPEMIAKELDEELSVVQDVMERMQETLV